MKSPGANTCSGTGLPGLRKVVMIENIADLRRSKMNSKRISIDVVLPKTRNTEILDVVNDNLKDTIVPRTIEEDSSVENPNEDGNVVIISPDDCQPSSPLNEEM